MNSINNNAGSSKLLSKLALVDKFFSVLAIFYGFYLYYDYGVFDNGEFINNPVYWIVGGSLSLVISVINIPKLFFSRMRKSMVVNR